MAKSVVLIMTLRFVKTSILSSGDGIDFDNEVSVESEEVTKTRLAAEAAQNKPLFQQLADLKDRKQEEYDENTKKLFAPPKGLEEGDIEFFQEVEEAQARAKEAQKRNEELQLVAFRDAQSSDVKSHIPAAFAVSRSKKSHQPPAKPPTLLKGTCCLQFMQLRSSIKNICFI